MNTQRPLSTAAAFVAALPLLLASSTAFAASELREELHKTFPLSAEGRVSLDNVNGPIRITAWDQGEVKLDAVKRAYSQERLDEVEIKIDADKDAVRIRTKYPSSNHKWGWRRKDQQASVEYTLSVPYGVRLDSINSVNGRVEIEGVAGPVEAATVNGRLNAKGLSGRAKLSTVNGRVEAAFDKLASDKSVSVSTVNGPVSVTLPDDANADISANTVNGGINNDFGLTVQKNFPISRHLKGKLGVGGPRLKLETVNGSITIHRAPGKNAAKAD
ncbi:MAG: DUF4097 family beta strand repeat protein [Verrucomicrobia bacterium]|nr:DUF4097 family beta strand repeat protein [Verrucomicrobiota bacterium]